MVIFFYLIYFPYNSILCPFSSIHMPGNMRTSTEHDFKYVTCTEEAPLVQNRCEIHCFVLKVPYFQLCPRQNDVQHADFMQALCRQISITVRPIVLQYTYISLTACIQRAYSMIG